jgi:uncharacterized protein with ACT and thioredoxin-like domain
MIISQLDAIERAVKAGKTLRNTFGGNIGGGEDVFEIALDAISEMKKPASDDQPDELTEQFIVNMFLRVPLDSHASTFVLNQLRPYISAPKREISEEDAVDVMLRAFTWSNSPDVTVKDNLTHAYRALMIKIGGGA